MTDLITSGMNPDVPPIDLAHKDVREAWLEGVIRQTLADLVYIEGCVANPKEARQRYLNLKDDLSDAIRRIDEGDAKRKAVWTAKRNQSFTSRKLPAPFIGEGNGRPLTRQSTNQDDPSPLFLRGG